MKLWSDSFRDGEAIPAEFAFARIDPKLRVALAPNRNPHLAWWDLPEGTRSLALVCHDFDAPSVPDDVNHPDREVPTSLARVDFYHWVLVDLPATLGSIAAGEFSDLFLGWFVLAAWGSRNALGSARLWLHVAACVPLLTTFYYGYDGPCPPWNDALIHRYQFALHALDVERLPLEGRFTGAQALAAMHGHVLARATVTCSYTLNPRLAGPVPPAA